MSWDLYLWHKPVPRDAEHALEICHRLADEDESAVEPYIGIEGFMTELLARFPRLEDLPDERIDEGVWSMSPTAGVGYVILMISTSWIGEVSNYLDNLADKYMLVLYDPQSGEYVDYTQS